MTTPKIEIGFVTITLDDMDVMECLCKVREVKNEYVVMEDTKSRDLLVKDGYIKVNSDSGHCWGTAKLKCMIKQMRKTLEKETEEAMKSTPKVKSELHRKYTKPTAVTKV